LEVKTFGSPCNVAWYYEGKKLLASDFMQITSKGDTHELKIPETMLDDEGVYSCVVSNESGKDETEADVFIDEANEAPVSSSGGAAALKKPEILRNLSDKEAFEEDEVRFDVEIVGCEKVQWFLNDKEVKPSDRFQVMDKDDRYSFVITSVEIEDDGQIKAVAVNQCGKVEATCELLVEGSERFFS
jgi:Immunoglobulin I-set domain.